MATFEQVQEALRREQAAKEAYDALVREHDASGPKGSATRPGHPDAYTALRDTPEHRAYEAAAAELTRLTTEARKAR